MWSPLQSPEARDICRHLTPLERYAFAGQAMEYGLTTAFRCAIPAGLIAGSFAFSLVIGLSLSALFVLYFFMFERGRIRTHQAFVRELLCATAYGRAQGYRPENLPLLSFPWASRFREERPLG